MTSTKQPDNTSVYLEDCCCHCRHGSFSTVPVMTNLGERLGYAGKCIRKPPVISHAVVTLLAQRNPDMSIIDIVEIATLWPAVFARDLCGEFVREIAPGNEETAHD